MIEAEEEMNQDSTIIELSWPDVFEEPYRLNPK
jgi:hypothetical protein